jgi:DNA-binding FadR family transcriptional regulator
LSLWVVRDRLRSPLVGQEFPVHDDDDTVALEVRGTLEVRHGDGIYLRSLPNDSGHLMELMTQRHRLPSILEAREALETQLAALAAARRTDADIAAMDSALEAMAADIDADGLGEEGDRLFHEAVTRAARRPPTGRFHGRARCAHQRDPAEFARRTGTAATLAQRTSPHPGGNPPR